MHSNAYARMHRVPPSQRMLLSKVMVVSQSHGFVVYTIPRLRHRRKGTVPDLAKSQVCYMAQRVLVEDLDCLRRRLPSLAYPP
jgi:hypothetical protein